MNDVVLHHPRGVEVHIVLPADAEVVGETIRTLAAMGYSIPAAEGKSKMTMMFEIPKEGN